MAKAFFVDTSRCTACRGCQIACKEWKNLPASPTKQRGTHQNPEDLNGTTLKLVRFEKEHKVGDKVVWNFFPDQCRHCEAPGCLEALNDAQKSACFKDPASGAVIYTEGTKAFPQQTFEDMKSYCPYNIPRRNELTAQIAKCDMCINRVANGLLPACVKVCLSGAMSFGERDEILAKANARLEEVKKSFPDAKLVDADSVCVIYLITEAKQFYHEYTTARERKIFRRAGVSV